MRDADVLADLDVVRGVLRQAGWTPADAAVLGFCLGGRFAHLAAIVQAWGAAVSFYPGGIVTPAFGNLPALVGRAAELRTPWLGLFGDEDDTIPIGDVEQLRASLAAGGRRRRGGPPCPCGPRVPQRPPTVLRSRMRRRTRGIARWVGSIGASAGVDTYLPVGRMAAPPPWRATHA